MYPIADGLEPGGLHNVRDGVHVWEDFHVELFRLPDRRTVEREEATKWALATMPPGLPDGYAVKQTTVSTRFWADDPDEQRIAFQVEIPELEILWCGQNVVVDTQEDAVAKARDNHAFAVLCGLQVQRSGWVPVRPLTEEELVAIRYIAEHGYFARSGVRMDTDEDIAEQQRVEREEASLELACEEGIIPGAMPADI
jgi:hypothetical protein